jgi:hypothetical protein
MDWTTVGAVISTALGSGFLGNWLAQRRQRRDKLEERLLLRNDGFRSDLRHAYAQVIASCSKLLSLARNRAIVLRASQKSPNPAPGEFLPLTRPVEHIELRNEFSAAKVDAEVRIAELILLEEDAVFHDLLDKLWIQVVELRSPNADDSYVEDVSSCQGDLDALLKVLAGAFSPSSWDRRMRSLETGSALILRASSSCLTPQRRDR